MTRRIIIVVCALIIVFGIVFGFHYLRGVMIGKYVNQMMQQPVTISTSEAKVQPWTSTIQAVGNLTAVNGVDVNSQVPGQVVKVAFQSGQDVKKGNLLVQLDDRLDRQNLQTQMAQLNFVQQDYNRKKALAQQKVISPSELDKANTDLRQAQSVVAAAQLSIAFKQIRAPFNGRLGISQVNVGQYISPGVPLVTIQQMDPLFVDFSLPEQQLRLVYNNQPVEVRVDEFPHQRFPGKISAINSRSDPTTHTIGVRAEIPNPDTKLYPGLFAVVNVILPTQQSVVTVPQTAINYSLNGDSVFVVVNKKDQNGKTIQQVEQRFVKVGDRKDNVAVILSGVQAGEQVVTSGQLKLQPGMTVHVDNSVKLKD
ncbi:MAG: efflux RND transporter periplasmic adaptor subunit [Proteobacteria bacterium]|nr:efflux RND transporter periplasmic adaptor subunit [Pseudomonadota bacterium]